MSDQTSDRKQVEASTGDHGPAPDTADLMLASMRARQQQLQTTAAALQSSLDSLRVSVKYLVFDLEATRRENANLRRQLEATRGGQREEPPEGFDPIGD